MKPSELADLLTDGTEDDEGTSDSAVIYPLVADSGNQRVLQGWLADHDTYRPVDAEIKPAEPDFDLCIVDAEALQEHSDVLEEYKSDAEPILLPVLLLLPERRTDVIDIDQGDIADSVFPTTVDEIVSLPIRQAELEWRIRSLLRLRAQSITAREQREELRLFRQAVESTGHAIYITDTDGKIKYVNESFEEITGYSAAEALGETPQLLHSGEMPDGYFADLWETLRSGEPWERDIIDQRKNGELYTAAQTIAPVESDGVLQGFVAVQNDITEREKRTETLRRRTRATHEAPVGITITDPSRDDNPMIYVNDAFVEMTGYPREAAVGRNCRLLQGENTDPERVAEIREAIDSQEPISTELRNYRKDGTEFWNHLEIAPVRDATGSVVNWVGFQQDVTNRRNRLEQLGILDRVLRHNLRNDLNVIRGWAETIRDGGSGEDAMATERIIETSDQLVAMARKEREITTLLKQRPQLTRIDIPPLLDRIAREGRSEHPEATIEIECPDGLKASASPELDRAIGELVTNAIVHNDVPSPEVTVSATETSDAVRIEIADDAPQIPEMERKILLEEKHRTPLYHGSGLGLWLVKLVVNRSGGIIRFRQKTPRGNGIIIEI
jgi:PAS domain S-box-containing protein